MEKNIFAMLSIQNISTLCQGTIGHLSNVLNKFLITPHGSVANSVTGLESTTGVSGTIEQGTPYTIIATIATITIIMEVIRAVVITMEINVRIGGNKQENNKVVVQQAIQIILVHLVSTQM